MHAGAVVAAGPPAEILTRERLRQVYRVEADQSDGEAWRARWTRAVGG
jgi:ABC-type cobalamin/Fe3+-siderophores transport system ATPase subunit